MTVNKERRFAGLERLYGVHGAARIRAAHVVVVGVGGVGSWAAETLVRSGIEEITLIDFDQISESNINRQLHALTSTVGQAKVDALKTRFLEINPDCQIHVIEEFVEAPTATSPTNWPALLAGKTPTALIDACDQVRVKTLLAHWAIESNVPFITIGAAGGKKLGHCVEIDDLVRVTHDPLLAQMRYRLRKEQRFPKKGRMRVNCVFSREEVKLPDATCELDAPVSGTVDGTLNCAGYGSTMAVTATFGMVAAGQILFDIARADQA